MARQAAETAARLARDGRRDTVKPYYDSYKASHSVNLSRVVPDFEIFLEWAAVKPLWEPADAAPMSDIMWARALPAIRTNFADYQDELRVEAIRAILWATTGAAPLSHSPADYPESRYDEDWFERPTAMFWGDSYSNLGVSYPRPYPDTLWDHAAGGCRKEWLRKHIGSHEVAIMRIILDAIGRKESSIKWWELGQYDLRWVDSPYKLVKERDRYYNYVELLYALKRRGPRAYELTSGTKVPQIEVWQDDDDFALEGEGSEGWDFDDFGELAGCG